MSNRGEVASLVIPGVAAVMVYLYIHSPIDAASWTLPPLRAMPVDNRLSKSMWFFEGEFPGAEHVHIDCVKKKCTAYTGLGDGRVVRWDPDQPQEGFEVLARTGCVDECPPDEIIPKCGGLAYEHLCGRPLGVHLTADRKTLLIAEPYKGLLALSLADKKLTRVASTYEDKEGNILPLFFVNNIAVSKRGRVYFTQTSKKFERREYYLEMMEGQASGSLVMLDSWNQKKPPKLITGNLTFANGVLVDEKESYALVAETSRSRIMRVDLKTHAITPWIEDLQGSPDNLAWGAKDGALPDYRTVWVGCPAKRSAPFAFANFLGDKLSMRMIFATILHRTKTSHLFSLLIPVTAVVLKLQVEAGGASGSIAEVLLDRGGEAARDVSTVAPYKDSLLLGAHRAETNRLMVYTA